MFAVVVFGFSVFRFGRLLAVFGLILGGKLRLLLRIDGGGFEDQASARVLCTSRPWP